MPHKTCFAPFYPTIEIVGYFHKAPMHRGFVRCSDFPLEPIPKMLVILSAAKNLSRYNEIPRSAQNDNSDSGNLVERLG